MIGVTGAHVVILILLIWIAVAGVVAGGLACLMLRRRWGPKAALLDAALAAGVAIVLFFIAAEVESAVGSYRSLDMPVLLVAVASVVGRHLTASRASKREVPTL
jgi:peptidoglycan/LPS O-acetylase OafA/YrhL